MKLKSWELWLCVVALLAGAFLLLRANLQTDAAQVALREVRQEAGQLRAQLDQLKMSGAAAQNTENARLHAENQNLSQKFSQLQDENLRLREQNQKLTQQLETAHKAVQQQQEQLQQMQADNQPASAAPEPASPAAAQLNACLNNLRQIDAAKQQWALENDKPDAAVPTAQDLRPYFAGGVLPVCPSGGTYAINAVAVPPTCSIPGHVLP